MKRCPTCNRAFADNTLTVCPNDGSSLTAGREVPTTQSDGELGGKATWTPSPDQLAEIQQTVTAINKPRRKTWPGVVIAIVVLLLLIGLAGAIALRRL